MRFVSGLAGAFALATLPALSLAQEVSTVPEQLIGMVGDWRLEQEDQALPACALTFTEDQTTDGWQIAVPEPCPLPFPSANEFAAWNVDADGTVLITDTGGKLVLRLVEGENGLYMTEPGVVPAFYLMLPYDQDGMGGEVGDEVAD